MPFLKKLLLLLSIMACCIALDQATKKIARDRLQQTPRQSFVFDTFRLQYAENKGAFLSLGSNLPDKVGLWVLIIIPIAFLVGIFLFILFSKNIREWERYCLYFILSGGVSNLLDRILYGGKVVDFLNLGIGPLRTGIFNLADMFITGGATLLIILSFKKKPRKNPAKIA